MLTVFLSALVLTVGATTPEELKTDLDRWRPMRPGGTAPKISLSEIKNAFGGEIVAGIEVVENINELDVDLGGAGSSVGTGGMITKLTAARIACAAGCKTIVCLSANLERDVEAAVIEGQSVGTSGIAASAPTAPPGWSSRPRPVVASRDPTRAPYRTHAGAALTAAPLRSVPLEAAVALWMPSSISCCDWLPPSRCAAQLLEVCSTQAAEEGQLLEHPLLPPLLVLLRVVVPVELVLQLLELLLRVLLQGKG